MEATGLVADDLPVTRDTSKLGPEVEAPASVAMETPMMAMTGPAAMRGPMVPGVAGVEAPVRASVSGPVGKAPTMGGPMVTVAGVEAPVAVSVTAEVTVQAPALEAPVAASAAEVGASVAMETPMAVSSKAEVGQAPVRASSKAEVGQAPMRAPVVGPVGKAPAMGGPMVTVEGVEAPALKAPVAVSVPAAALESPREPPVRETVAV